MHELLDDEQLIYALLRRDMAPEVMVAPEVDVTTWDTLPYATFFCIAEEVASGPDLWSVLVTYNAFGDGSGEAFELCRSLHAVTHSWATPGVAVLPGLGSIEDVTTVSKFSRVGTVTVYGKNVTQYAGSYSLLTRYQPPTP